METMLREARTIRHTRRCRTVGENPNYHNVPSIFFTKRCSYLKRIFFNDTLCATLVLMRLGCLKCI